MLRRSRQLVKQAGQLEELAHHMEQGWEPEVRLVVDAAYPTARIVRLLSAFMPQSRGCRVLLREEVLSGVEEALIQGAADLAISGLIIPGHLAPTSAWSSSSPWPTPTIRCTACNAN